MNLKNKNITYLKIIFSILFIGAMIGFIISTFKDQEINRIFWKLRENDLGKYWVAWCLKSGDLQLFPIFFLMIGIFFETFYSLKTNSEKDNWFKRNKWFIYVLYAIMFIGAIVNSFFQMRKVIVVDNGLGKGQDLSIIGSTKYKLTVSIILMFFSWVAYILLFYYTRFKLSKKDIETQSWMFYGAARSLIFIGLAFLTVGVLKIVFGRPFFFNTDQIVGDEIAKKYPDSNLWIQQQYVPWYKPYDFVNHMKSIFTKFDMGDYGNDFPSGHIVSTFCLLTPIYFKRKTKETKLQIALISIWLVQVLSMTFGMVAYGFHWMSDMTFSIMFSIIYFWASTPICKKLLKIKWFKTIRENLDNQTNKNLV